MLAEQFVQLIGYENSTIIFHVYGGRSLHIPKKRNPNHPIAQLIGYEAFCKLVEAHATELLFIPRVNRLRRKLEKIDGHLTPLKSKT